MLPTLKPGQDVLVWCWFNKYKIGDIVVINQNGRVMVKRIHLYHGRNISVLGDNPKESTDSRNFGPIRKEQIIGKVIWY